MALIKPDDYRFMEAISALSYVNPFLPDRIQYEREALGDAFDESKADWNLLGDDPEFHLVNTRKITERAYPLLTTLQKRLAEGVAATGSELKLYEDTALFLIYHHYAQQFKADIIRPKKGRTYDYFNEFLHYWELFFDIDGYDLPEKDEAAHIFACLFQVRRAFLYIFRAIIGRSKVAAHLRAAVWDSIFTHDMQRYRRSFYKRMGDFTTLIIGPTGSGKELVANAIGQSRYIPFDTNSLTFQVDFFKTFFPINLSALPATLVESELFGHRRGAFTGALEDRKGWLEACPAEGTIFIDEIGELDPLIQVKLLRVIQARTFQRLGSTKTLAFKGKIVAATHRDIHADMAAGKFRKDLYYRLCSDIITTPSLYEQMRESPDVLWDLVGYIAKRIAGDENEKLSEDVKSWIKKRIGLAYDWPGNIRELEQCVRNVMIRGAYHPVTETARNPAGKRVDFVLDDVLSLEEMCRLYCRQVYAQAGSYVETARRLKVDRRTVKKYVGAKKEHSRFMENRNRQ
ncbi:MAG: sigma-54-dependent Fis family transcriptional regulator [Deltaproteobacteria bacterium]|nr:MAG: sigma-54-dependent Fis family transcriptional regulator [Deltaproteobacteria bacterium]